MDDIPAVGVLGVGTMGAGIVQLAAQTGHSVVACDQSVEALEKAQRYVWEGASARGSFAPGRWTASPVTGVRRSSTSREDTSFAGAATTWLTPANARLSVRPRSTELTGFGGA